ncbi:MAG: PIG-L family deacetylase [Gemmatimonadaceae bacterium]|nr:PIG-L family deacetylase [Gemmatimonadaceae bacterium]
MRAPFRITAVAAAALLAHSAPRAVSAQPGAVPLHDISTALGTTARVLMIGAHPDDEDTQLLGWLARGAKVDAAYLSLTRGDGGQNAIGNDLGEGLGAVRTEELLAARRIDGARQFFTRAYDFGFSKTAEETYRHWPKDSVFGDVVRIVRAFRPHVIIAVFSGTPRDGHGHHQVSGMLAKEAYEASMDTVRFPVRTYGAPWTAGKFYRAARFNAAGATLRMDVGTYDPIRGEGLGEIAGQSRSQHRSQGFGVAQPRGVVTDYVRREATRLNPDVEATRETSIFDGFDPTLARFGAVTLAPQRPALDSLRTVLAALRAQVDAVTPWTALPRIDLARRLLDRWCTAGNPARSGACRGEDPVPDGVNQADADLLMSAARTFGQLQRLAEVSSGLMLEATVTRERIAEGDTASFTVRITNRSPFVARVSVFTPSGAAATAPRDTIAPGEAYVTTLPLPSYPRSAPWWIRTRADSSLATLGNEIVEPVARAGDMFVEPASTLDEAARSAGPTASVPAVVNGVPVQLTAPITWRRIDEVNGQIDSPVMSVPRVAVTIDGGQAGYVRAGVPFTRVVTVRVVAQGPVDGPVTVRLQWPRGVASDSATRQVTLVPGAETAVPFTLRGTLVPGRHVMTATVQATVGGATTTYATGYQRIEYPHIRAQHLYRPAAVALEAVGTGAMPRGLVGYIDGLADNVAPALSQLGATVEKLPATAITPAALSRFAVIVVGPRALEAQPALASRMPALHAWVRTGGTMIVQYQQADIARPGMAPFPLTFARPAARVTEEDAAVRVLNPASRLLTVPNRIEPSDWNGWVQERATYMPTTADSNYATVLGMHDGDEAENANALLTARIGKGTYVFTTLALFRQLPAGVPGAARIVVNILNAGSSAPAPKRRPVP